MEKDQHQTDDGFEKEMKHLKEEVEHEGEKINQLEKELEFEQKEVKHLSKEIEELEKFHDEQNHHRNLHLLFIVNGKAEKISVEPEWTLEHAVKIALRESGNEGRPLTDWTVKYNNKVLDLNKKIKEFHFAECAELFLSLNAGHGGNFNQLQDAND
jgi:predicted RNase H-like nuclease (RuvC/YqgF family)